MKNKPDAHTQKLNTIVKNIGRRILVVFFWLAIWQTLSLIAGTPLLLAGPIETLIHLCKDAVTGSFWYAILISMSRILMGLVTGFLFGGVLSIFSFCIPLCKLLIKPFLHFCKAVPVASFAVILLVWWGSDFISFTICMLVVTPIVAINVLEGLDQVSHKMLEMAKVFQLPLHNKLLYLYRPALNPFLISSVKTGLGMGIKAGIAAEVIGITRHSIGGSLYTAKIYLDTAGVFSWTIVVIFLSILLEKGTLYLLKQFIHYNPNMKKRKSTNTSRKEAGENSRLVLHTLSKRYDQKVIFEGVSKEITENSIICLMAPSGAGKTTLLHIIAGLVEADAGKVLRNGNEPIGMVFQEDRLCDNLTALQNVLLIGTPYMEVKEYLLELLSEDAFNLPVSALSGGMKRRVCIARALACNTDLLLLDEPFNGMDEMTKKQAILFIRNHQNKRPTIIVTHDKEDAILLGAQVWNFVDKY